MKLSLETIILLLLQCAFYWAADCPPSRFAVRNGRKYTAYRIGLSASDDSPSSLVTLSFANSGGSQQGQMRIYSPHLKLVSKTGGVYVFKLNFWAKAKFHLKKFLRSKIIYLNVFLKFNRQQLPYPRVQELKIGNFNCTVPKKKIVCKELTKPCETYKYARGGQDGVETGFLLLPVNPFLQNWTIIVGFASKVGNLQLNHKANQISQECKRIFTFEKPPRYRPWISRRYKSVVFRYTLAFDANTTTAPNITYIYYGNAKCNTSCGVEPVCPITTLAPPVTELTTSAPPPVVETTTEEPTVEETTTALPPTVGETTTEAPVGETTTESPAGETTTESPPPVEETTTEAPIVGETTTEAPPPVEETTTGAPPPVEETTTEAPLPVVETTTEAPPTVEETTTEAPLPVEETTTEAPSPVGETTTEAPLPPLDELDEDDIDIFDDFF